MTLLGSPRSIGPYRIVDVLGRGGMGVVYNAEHITSGEPVALKIVSGVSRTGTAAIRREIQALSRVRHPGVVRVREHGIEEGLPWYAMELIEGRTLRAMLDDGPRRAFELARTVADLPDLDPVPAAHEAGVATSDAASPLRPIAPRLVEICAAVCDALAVVHAAGIVHRDLKPENVLIAPGGRPVLVDFGIAAGFGGVAGREALAANGPVIGTPAYMAPEQIRGELVDARADLYALGCILYECVTGQAPFVRRSVTDLLGDHLLADPIAPSRRGVDVPPELEALILRLLAKRPSDRIGHAADVAATLRELGYGHPGDADPVGSTAPVGVYLFRAELTGRDDFLRRARSALEALSQRRRGGVIYVGGESGVGKMRLAMEILGEAERSGVTAVTGQCLAGERGSAAPLHPFAAIVREAMTSGLSGAHARVLAPYFPELASSPAFSEAPEPPRLPPDAARTRALDAIESVLFDLASPEPLLVVLDDVQWADELSLAHLGRLDAEKLASRGVLVLAFYRAEEAGEALLQRAGAAGVERWDLSRLDEASVAKMAAGMLATPRLPPAWSEMLARVSDGNPFFAAEYLRAAVDAGLLHRDRRGRWSIRSADAERGEALAVPTSVEALLGVRFERLGPGERQLLGAAAVLGRTLETEIAAAAAGMQEDAAVDAATVLLRRQILETTPDGRLRFVHDRLREAAYARLGSEERRALHGAAANAIEARHADDPAQLGPLAQHHAAAGRHVAAHWYSTLAASRAASVYATDQAIALHRMALREAEAGGAADVRCVESAAHLGELLHRANRSEEAREAYAAALLRLPATSSVQRARLHLAVGKTWGTRQQHAEALAACAQAETALGAAPSSEDDEAGWWEAKVQIGIDRIQIHYWAADNEALARVVADLGAIVERRGTDTQRAYYFLTLVQRDLRGARYRTSPETVGHARRSVAAFERARDRDQIANARFTLAAVLLWNDALDEAEVEMQSALDEAEAIGISWIRVASLAYLTMILRRRRDVDGMRAVSLRCLTLSEEAKLAQYAGVAEANLGWAQMEDGSVEEAERLCASALARWRGLPLVYPFQWLSRLPLAKLAVGAGQFDEAAEHLRATLEETQQRLPDGLAAALSGGSVEEALAAAERMGFV